MPRTATAPKPRVEPRSVSQRTPAVIAIERLAKLSTQGAPAAKIVSMAREIISGWRAGGVQPGTLRDEIEALAADLDLGIEAAENWISEAETDGQRKSAQVQFDTLRRTREVVQAELG